MFKAPACGNLLWQPKQTKKHATINGKEVEVAILMSDKADIKAKNSTRNKVHFIMIEESVYQDYIIILNVYIPKKVI